MNSYQNGESNYVGQAPPPQPLEDSNHQSSSMMNIEQTQPQMHHHHQQQQPNGTSTSNPYAAVYLNTVKENRSLYGNYLDNTVTYDPHKEKSSHFNTVYETADTYNPWGRPGGGAPVYTGDGRLKTKIVGTLRWNLNGETDADRKKRLANGNNQVSLPSNKNTLIYRKNPIVYQQPNGANPRLVHTTYKNEFRDPHQQYASASMKNLNSQHSVNSNTNKNDMYSHAPVSYQYAPSNQHNHQQQQQHSTQLPLIQPQPQQQQQQQQQQPQYDMITKTEREAQLRNLERTNGGGPFVSASTNGFYIGNDRNPNGVSNLMNNSSINWSRNKNGTQLNRTSNKLFNDNEPTAENPNTPFWFGRAGTYNSSSLSSFQSGSSSDFRRRKLFDELENRHPSNMNKFSMSNDYLPSSTISNHKNRYELPTQ